ncbi:MAG: hypothetical protein P1V20_15415 [Verrucomicrobiales bacterium]|nr:hypothetical protein [Verrucomicrobiales bacterium]
MHKQIISIHGRAESGISRPFLCQDESGQSWFVKRSNVTWDQLVLEFVLGNLAMKFGLPSASFALLEIPELLSRRTLAKDRGDFEPGTAFGSRRIPFGEDLGETHIRHIPDETKAEVFCFDWWTANSDRRLLKTGGSPNLIWDPELHSFFVIDHDRALDPDFEAAEFFREHVFRDIRPFLERQTVMKLRQRFESAVKTLPEIWKQLPGEWLADESGTARATLTPQSITKSLLEPGNRPVEGVLAVL